MKHLAAAVTALLVSCTPCFAQWSKVYTRPDLPAEQVLDRLNLKLAWHAKVTTDGRRDGLFSVQAVGDQVLVQTVSGLVCAISAEDGWTLWRSRVGIPYRANHPLAVNSRSIFVCQGPRLFAIDRMTGRQQWEMALSYVPTSAPAADNERIYVTLSNGRLTAYELPRDTGDTSERIQGDTKADRAAGVAMSLVAGPQPQIAWELFVSAHMEQTPLLTPELILVAGNDGTFLTSLKQTRRPQYAFKNESAIVAPLGQYQSTAYIPMQDYNVYALNIETGKFGWRFPGGAPLRLRPEVNDEDVYITPDRVGLYRLDRLTGDPIWQNRTAVRFLAANKKFVYANDELNRLLVLDRLRGSLLATYDTHDFVVPVSNEITDRLFLASNDGQVLCLHDRDYPKALVMKTMPVEASKSTATVKAEPKPEAEKEIPKPAAKPVPAVEKAAKGDAMEKEMKK